jgi:RNA polymerase sigma-70 factor (ECF subfamily)
MAARFDTTDWGVVLKAAEADSPTSQRALARLCEAYWYPLYAFIRRRGYSAPDAEDLTQAYFARFLEKGYLKDLRPESGGRFRSFLLASAKHFLANERDHARALKRGGGLKPVSIPSSDAEDRYARELVDNVTPETVFERNWATTVIEQALVCLEAEIKSADGLERFALLKPYLTGDGERWGYEEIAGRLGVSGSAVRVAVLRLRRRFGVLLREEISRTVGNRRDVDAEIRYLLAIPRG